MLFGRITYDLMVSYWPTPVARENDPLVAECMNDLPKHVYSPECHHDTFSLQ